MPIRKYNGIMRKQQTSSWYIEGQACYIGRDYERHLWCTTKKPSEIHYFTVRSEAEWVLRCIGRLSSQLQLQIKRA